MALSTCVKCDGRLFELKEQSPRGANYKVQFVQCSGCGAPIGAMEYFDSGAMLHKQEKLIGELTKKVARLEHSLSQIDHNVRAIAKFLERNR